MGDAETFAVLEDLRRVEAEEGDAGERRVLGMCDCKPAMMAIEAAWRRVGKAGVPEVEGLRTWDRGAMLEAICAIRARLGRVVFMWVPAHEGVTPNSYADAAAKAHLQARVVAADVTAVVAREVRSRDVVWERRVRGGGSSQIGNRTGRGAAEGMRKLDDGSGSR